MPRFLNGLSGEERAEIYLDMCTAFNTRVILEEEFRATLGELGYNATDIEEIVTQHAPREEDS